MKTDGVSSGIGGTAGGEPTEIIRRKILIPLVKPIRVFEADEQGNGERMIGWGGVGASAAPVSIDQAWYPSSF